MGVTLLTLLALFPSLTLSLLTLPVPALSLMAVIPRKAAQAGRPILCWQSVAVPAASPSQPPPYLQLLFEHCQEIGDMPSVLVTGGHVTVTV